MPPYESNEIKSTAEEFSIKMKGLSLLINAIILQSRSSSFNKYICCQPIVSRIGNVQRKVKRGWTGWINLVIIEKGNPALHVCVNVIWTYYNTIMGMWFVPKINLHTCIIRSLVHLTFSFSACYRNVDVHIILYNIQSLRLKIKQDLFQ